MNNSSGKMNEWSKEKSKIGSNPLGPAYLSLKK